MAFRIGQLVSRYCIVILLPTFVATSIYSDYTHTQEWKREVAKKANKDVSHYS